MGHGDWNPTTFASTATVRAAKTIQETFVEPKGREDTDPSKMVVRESRDSADHPQSTAIIVAFDVTGSMGDIPHYFARTALGALMRELQSKQPVSDPQLLVAAVGDSSRPYGHSTDKYPLQVGQFESDIRIDKWLTALHLEGGGGGTSHESYGLVYHFAGEKTSVDCMEKRGKKGYLFTVGDEAPHRTMEKAELKEVFGDVGKDDVTLADAIASATRLYDVFHIIVASTSYPTSVHLAEWRKVLGENVLVLEDYRALPELIMTTIGAREGMHLADATAGFAPETYALVKNSGAHALSPRAAGDIVKL